MTTIAVYGASGYQGSLTVAELLRRGVEPVLIGRDRERLAASATAPAITQVRVASVDDRDAMVAALTGCDAVINTAGPFTTSGTAVAHAAIDARVHYVDTAGEQAYVKQVFDTLDRPAQDAAVTLIPAATDGGVSGDLIASLVAERLSQDGAGEIDRITVGHKIVGGGGPSRGSLRSLLQTAQFIGTGGLTYADGDWRTDIPLSQAEFAFPGDAEPTAVARFPLIEVVTIPRHIAAKRVESVVEAALIARFSSPQGADFIDTLPVGPSASARAEQRFSVVVQVTTRRARQAIGSVQGCDTYGTTAVIASEVACRLAAGPRRAGVLTAAQAFDPRDLLDALAPCGLTWQVTT